MFAHLIYSILVPIVNKNECEINSITPYRRKAESYVTYVSYV